MASVAGPGMPTLSLLVFVIRSGLAFSVGQVLIFLLAKLLLISFVEYY